MTADPSPPTPDQAAKERLGKLQQYLWQEIANLASIGRTEFGEGMFTAYREIQKRLKGDD